MQDQSQEEIQKFMTKIKEMEKGEKLDLSSDEDLSIGIMNLISIEEHMFFTYNKTKDVHYLEILNDVREMRKSLLKKIIKEYEGEVWCISKHLLAASMRVMEVGTKALTKGDVSGAEDLFQKSYQLYSLFWGLNLGVVNVAGVEKNIQENGDRGPEMPKKDADKTDVKEEVKFLDEGNPTVEKGSASIFEKLGLLVQKAIDCCKE